MPMPLCLADVFRAALRVFGPERILFGTDSTAFPRGWRRDIFATQIEVLKTLDSSPQQRDLVLGGNLVRVLGL